MKKTILVVLIAVMTATPCLAQEIEPEGMFSIEGTKWGGISLFPIPWPPMDDMLGFYNNKVFYYQSGSPGAPLAGWYMYDYSYVVNTFVASFFGGFTTRRGGFQTLFGIVQPMGIGLTSETLLAILPPLFIPYVYILYKTDDNWTPPIYTYSFYISPDEGEQGTTLTDVLIECLNTTFEDNPPVEINFNLPDGLTVSNIDVISNTEIEFDLEIAVDAPIGYRDVIVTYDYWNQAKTGTDAFEVLPRSN